MDSRIIQGDCIAKLAELPADSVDCCVTSPPYWGLRDYGTSRWEGGNPDCEHIASERTYTEQTAAVSSAGAFSEAGEANAERLKKGRWRESGHCTKCGAVKIDHQVGLEGTPDEFVAKLVEVFREVRRVLKSEGTLWLNLGDSYNAYNGNAGPGSGFSRGAACDTQRPKLPSGHGLRTNSLKPKDLVGIPWRVAFALQADGWYLRQDIIWAKPNPMPESVQDRCTKAHEYIFLLSKSERYYFNSELIAEDCADSSIERWDQDIDNQEGSDRVPGKTNGPMKAVGGKRKVNGGASFGKQNHSVEGTGAQSRTYERPVYEKRNRRSVWTVTTKPYKGAHFATFPEDLILPCILAGCPEGGTVLDPFLGSGTTLAVALKNGCNGIGIELNPDYVELARKRIEQRTLFGESA